MHDMGEVELRELTEMQTGPRYEEEDMRLSLLLD